MEQVWTNWSGSLSFRPGAIVRPSSEEELAAIVCHARDQGRTVRVAGTGHSSSPLVETSDILVTLETLQGVLAYDRSRCEATIGAGMTIHDAGQALGRLGMAFSNLGDVDYQTAAGAFGTGTHGTGVNLPGLASHLIGGRLVNGHGEIEEFGTEDDLNLVRALRVSLGAAGIFTALRLRLVPAYKLRKREWCTRIDDCLAHFDELAATCRQVDFYWYPRSDEAKIRTTDLIDADPPTLPSARLVDEATGWSHEVIPNARELRFDEMEYGVPAEAGARCFVDVRQRIKARWRHIVGWRVLYRTMAADEMDLSIAYERPTVTISIHQNATLPYEEFFADIEPIFRAYGGRPHWGKKHSLRADDLQPLYPRWDRFLQARQQIDPEGVFLNAYLRDLLGIERLGGRREQGRNG